MFRSADSVYYQIGADTMRLILPAKAFSRTFATAMLPLGSAT